MRWCFITNKSIFYNPINPNYAKVDDKDLIKSELKKMVLETWANKAICYTDYIVSIDDKKYVVDVAVFVYREFPIKKVSYVHYDNVPTISVATVFDKKDIQKSIAYMTEEITQDTKVALSKVFDEVHVLSLYNLIEHYKKRISELQGIVKKELNVIYSFDRWFNRHIYSKLTKTSLLQIRTTENVIKLFSELKKVSGAKTNSDFLVWLMWKATICSIYEKL